MTPSRLHPAVHAFASRIAPTLPETLCPMFATWLERRGVAPNRAVDQVYGKRLQLVALFAGIDGLGSGLEAALDAVTVLQAEREPERRAVLWQHFSLALQVADVRELLEMPLPAPPKRLVVAGGFPCRGAGKANLLEWILVGMDDGLQPRLDRCRGRSPCVIRSIRHVGQPLMRGGGLSLLHVPGNNCARTSRRIPCRSRSGSPSSPVTATPC